MDIDLARTFLEIVRTGSFMAAAERLHITQTTVTARMQNLEGQLGCRLFIRNRSGASLTDNGERFAGHASQLVQTWEVARRELPLPEGAGSVLTLGAEISLWNPLLLNWVSALSQVLPDVALRTEVGEPRSLHERLEQGVLDAALVHQPDYWPGMQVEQLLEEKLIMVRTPHTAQPYVYVDWGAHFRQQHDAAWPEKARATVSMDLGPLAIQYLLANGGSGYFRTRVAQPWLEQGSLERVVDAPEFSYPVYLVCPKAKQSEDLLSALDQLRSTVKQADWRDW
ncbi:LysR family transcriptional regulator [Alcanivorax hongdengensis A-11-3]|uniref:LysR family transcriptional regulator n=1 Tax=Alcanivorax hongdengensis A-11-3 TaxID=1177179 RepID=L0W8H5_9GAMM|nr:LysR family transcriptional regulator [Alcanivorax hongdengensis]EKF73018.1 LysR family transcriptional regulator [Alcanivorax hongdengensis A-11-3]